MRIGCKLCIQIAFFVLFSVALVWYTFQDGQHSNQVSEQAGIDLKLIQDSGNVIGESEVNIFSLPTLAKTVADKNSKKNAQGKEILIRRNYKYKTVDSKLLDNLSLENQRLEHATDPLSLSAICKDEVFLLVLVISQTFNIKRRNIIRDTWAFTYEEDFLKLKYRKRFPTGKSYAADNVVKVVFVVGAADVLKDTIDEEIRLKRDVVIGSIVDVYRNLTLKMRMAYKWAQYDCKSSFILKTDDDAFVNPVVLVEWLKQAPQRGFYAGYCTSNSPVVRNREKKWYIPQSLYPASKYPTYCLGGGYLLSADVLKGVVENSYGRALFPIEDIYVGLLVNELHISARDERSHFILDFQGVNNDCEMLNIFVAHQVVGNEMVNLIKKVRNALLQCSISA